MHALESKLFETEDAIIHLNENRNNETEGDVHELSEAEKTFCNPSDVVTHCLHCKFESQSSEDLENHMRYVVFTALLKHTQILT